ARPAIALGAEDRFAVGPDNGIFTFVADSARAVSLAIPIDASPVFHGRDVFAPVAASLAGGVSLEDIRAPAESPERLPLPRPERLGRTALTETQDQRRGKGDTEQSLRHPEQELVLNLEGEPRRREHRDLKSPVTEGVEIRIDPFAARDTPQQRRQRHDPEQRYGQVSEAGAE